MPAHRTLVFSHVNFGIKPIFSRMTGSYPIHLIILLTGFLIISCQHENTQSYPAEFAPYVNEFFVQANNRGMDWDESHFTFSIQYGDTDPGIGGFCNFDNNTITVNPEEWALRDDRQKEHLIFHELGHCLLNRHHKNVESGSGECYSYMPGNEDGFTCSINYYSDYWRTYYLDELFDPTTPLPTWYLRNNEYSKAFMNYSHVLEIKDTLAEMLNITTFRFSQRDTFLFDIFFDDQAAGAPSVALFIGNLTFSHCDGCPGSKTNLALNNKIIYTSPDITTHSDIKLSVFRQHDMVSFYVNEYFVHAMEYSLIEGNWFRTTSFDHPVNMNIRYFYD